MRFALNYSPQAAALLDEGRIEIDLYKCPNWPDLVAEAERQKPVYIHFPIVAGRGTIETLDLAVIEDWLNRTETLVVNAHFSPRADVLPAGVDRDGVVEYGVRELELLTRRFGADRVILENVPYTHYETTRNILPEGVDPEVLRDVILGVGCGLLLDLSHAKLTCENTGRDYEAYLAALPTQVLRELHITGIGIHPEKQLREDHLPLQDEDWVRVEAAMDRIERGDWARPQTVALEYGGIGPMFEWRSETDVIAVQVPRLYALCQRAGQGA